MRREKKIIIQKWGKKSSKYLLLHWKCEVLPDSVQQVGCQFFLFLLSILLIVETLMSLPLRVDCVYLLFFFFCVCCLWNWIETYDVWPPSSICTIWCGFIYRNNLTVYFVFVSVWIFWHLPSNSQRIYISIEWLDFLEKKTVGWTCRIMALSLCRVLFSVVQENIVFYYVFFWSEVLKSSMDSIGSKLKWEKQIVAW